MLYFFYANEDLDVKEEPPIPMECDVSITVDQDLPKYEETTFNPWSEDESELEISVNSDSSDGLCEHNAAMLQAEIGIDEQENIDDPPQMLMQVVLKLLKQILEVEVIFALRL